MAIMDFDRDNLLDFDDNFMSLTLLEPRQNLIAQVRRSVRTMRDAKQIESIFGAAPPKRLELMAEILRQEQ